MWDNDLQQIGILMRVFKGGMLYGNSLSIWMVSARLPHIWTPGTSSGWLHQSLAWLFILINPSPPLIDHQPLSLDTVLPGVLLFPLHPFSMRNLQLLEHFNLRDYNTKYCEKMYWRYPLIDLHLYDLNLITSIGYKYLCSMKSCHGYHHPR